MWGNRSLYTQWNVGGNLATPIKTLNMQTLWIIHIEGFCSCQAYWAWKRIIQIGTVRRAVQLSVGAFMMDWLLHKKHERQSVHQRKGQGYATQRDSMYGGLGAERNSFTEPEVRVAPGTGRVRAWEALGRLKNDQQSTSGALNDTLFGGPWVSAKHGGNEMRLGFLKGAGSIIIVQFFITTPP